MSDVVWSDRDSVVEAAKAFEVYETSKQARIAGELTAEQEIRLNRAFPEETFSYVVTKSQSSSASVNLGTPAPAETSASSGETDSDSGLEPRDPKTSGRIYRSTTYQDCIHKSGKFKFCHAIEWDYNGSDYKNSDNGTSYEEKDCSYNGIADSGKSYYSNYFEFY